MKTKGCLHGKAEAQKKAFFKSLQRFYFTDEVFFFEQVNDLQWWELSEFSNFVSRGAKNKKRLIAHIVSMIHFQKIK